MLKKNTEYMFKSHSTIQKKKDTKSTNELEGLTPNTPVVDDEAYARDAEILDIQINSDGVNNIAIMADYGAGKSSLIKTYLNKYRRGWCGNWWHRLHKEHTYTIISLASFNNNDYTDREIEGSILQQLFYSQKKNKLPNSHVEKTNRTSKVSTFFLSLFLILLFTCMFLFTIRQMGGFLADKRLDFLNYVYLGVAFIISLILIWFLIYYKKLRKIHYKNIEVNFESNNNKGVTNSHNQSLLNKFIDEVLYFFECLNIDLIIFEDLDRHKKTNIFVKLRELNTIINNSKKRAKKVTFIYAVKNDTFKDSEERAKFFEFIISVVPVVNTVTVANKVRERNKKLCHEAAITEDFIKGVSIYIPNMRVLNNAFNDYIIMRERVFSDAEKGRLKNDNLFALSLFKNLFPRDYSELENDKGIIPLIIDIQFLRKKTIDELKSKKDKLQNLVEQSKKETLKSFDELKLILKGQILNPGYSPKYSYGSQKTKLSDITTFENLDWNNIEWPFQNYQPGIIVFPQDEINMLPNGDTYTDREANLRARECTEINEIQKNINTIDLELQDIQSLNFTDLVKKIGTEECFDRIFDDRVNDENVRKMLLESDNKNDYRPVVNYIKFLVKNHYIDDNYIEYTSSYKTNLINPTDVAFIKRVSSGEQSFDAEITNVNKVVEILKDADFEDVAILNFDILSNLKEIQNEKSKYEKLLVLLKNDKDDVNDAVMKFINKSDETQLKKFMEILIPLDERFCDRILATDISIDIAKKILRVLIASNYKYDIKQQNTKSAITKALSKVQDFIYYVSTIENVDTNEIINFLSLVTPKFDAVDVDHKDKNIELYKYIIDKSYYTINIYNLENILLLYNVSKNDFIENNYSIILSLGDKSITKYITSNIDDYVANVLLHDNFTCEHKRFSNISDLLKNTNIKIENKIKLIDKFDFEIADMRDYDKLLYIHLLLANRVTTTWKNIALVLLVNENNFEICQYLVKNQTALTETFQTDIPPEIQVKLITHIINHDYKKNVSEEMEKLTKKININNVPMKNTFMNDEYLSIFIKAKIIAFNKDDFGVLQNYPGALMAYVITYSDEITDKFDNFFKNTITSKTINLIMVNENISTAIKQKILTQYAEKIQMGGYEHAIYETITNSKLDIPKVLFLKFQDTDKLDETEKNNLKDRIPTH